jgi:hypothetical protein
LSSEVDEKLMELVHKCGELYNMSNKKYTYSVCKEKLWVPLGEELKKSGKFQYIFIARFEVTVILLSPKFQ